VPDVTVIDCGFRENDAQLAGGVNFTPPTPSTTEGSDPDQRFLRLRAFPLVNN